jgi:tetratricopeptide (TPR) repeat protein
MGEWREAIADYEKALRLRPREKAVQGSLEAARAALRCSKDPEEAREETAPVLLYVRGRWPQGMWGVVWR